VTKISFGGEKETANALIFLRFLFYCMKVPILVTLFLGPEYLFGPLPFSIVLFQNEIVWKKSKIGPVFIFMQKTAS